MPGYVYRGTSLDADEIIPDGRGMTRGPAECGTRPGYVRHLRNSEDVCEPCKEANRQYDRDYRKRRAIKEATA
jgi:hypothetical protein